METTVTGRHVPVTDELRRLIDRKLAKLSRLLNDSVVSAHVILSDGPRQHAVEVVLHVRDDRVLRGECDGDTWSQALVGAVEKVDQQAHTLKGKWGDRRRRAAP